MGALLADMNAPHKGYELRVADALWAQQDANFQADYLKLVQTNYGAGFHRVNFKLSPDTVRATINAWVEKQTNDKIKNLLAPGVVDIRQRASCSPTPSTSRATGRISSIRKPRRKRNFTSQRRSGS